jgi:hypothetical protein
MNKTTELFELLPCEMNQIVLENQNDYIVGILAEEKEVGIILSGYDGSILTFVDSGCADHAHINTVHQLLIKFKQSCGFKLSRSIIEAKYGDVIYCRLHWKNEKGDIYNVCSIGDALILHSLTGCDLFISKNVFDQFEPFDSQGYFHSFEDF